MSKQDIIRAWKDEEYREGLSESELSRLPQNPAGSVELLDTELADVGGGGTRSYWSYSCGGCWFSGGCPSYRDGTWCTSYQI